MIQASSEEVWTTLVEALPFLNRHKDLDEFDVEFANRRLTVLIQGLTEMEFLKLRMTYSGGVLRLLIRLTELEKRTQLDCELSGDFQGFAICHSFVESLLKNRLRKVFRRYRKLSITLAKRSQNTFVNRPFAVERLRRIEDITERGIVDHLLQSVFELNDQWVWMNLRHAEDAARIQNREVPRLKKMEERWLDRELLRSCQPMTRLEETQNEILREKMQSWLDEGRRCLSELNRIPVIHGDRVSLLAAKTVFQEWGACIFVEELDFSKWLQSQMCREEYLWGSFYEFSWFMTECSDPNSDEELRIFLAPSTLQSGWDKGAFTCIDPQDFRNRNPLPVGGIYWKVSFGERYEVRNGDGYTEYWSWDGEAATFLLKCDKWISS